MRLIKTRINWICSGVLIFVLLISMSACAVLTQSQVGEVNKFANAAKDYSELPGAVMKAHADIRMKRALLYTTTYENGENALKEIEEVIAFNERIAKESAEADKALGVLKSYAELLVKLTSDSYTNSLQGSAENLGTNIDNGIKAYNKMKGTNLSSFGSVVAAAVRGLGGIYIKHEQTMALRESVEKADPVVNEMINSVESLLYLYLSNDDRKEMGINVMLNSGRDDLIRNEMKELKDIYVKDIVPKYDGRQPIEIVSNVATEIIDEDNDIQLAKSAIKAAEAYRKAHSRLAENLKKKEDIKSMIEEIQVLANEVKAAQSLKKKLEQK